MRVAPGQAQPVAPSGEDVQLDGDGGPGQRGRVGQAVGDGDADVVGGVQEEGGRSCRGTLPLRRTRDPPAEKPSTPTRCGSTDSPRPSSRIRVMAARVSSNPAGN